MKIKEASNTAYIRHNTLVRQQQQQQNVDLLMKSAALIGLLLAIVVATASQHNLVKLVHATSSKPFSPPVALIEASSNNSQAAIDTSSQAATSSNARPPTGQQQQPAIADQVNNKQLPTNERINLIEADQHGLYLVGLFDIHHSNPRVPFKCGQIDVDVGEWHSRRPMQNMEAFLWAIEQVNADKSLLPGVRLGSLVMDTCSSFLRTNQQLANLLHGGGNPHPASAGKVTSNRQIAAIVADNSDWQSVEAVVSMASAQGLTTFVTQSRSSKLSELARKYRPTNAGQLDLKPSLRLSLQPGARVSSSMAALERAASAEQGRRLPAADASPGPLAPPLDGLLSELLGIGKMSTPRPSNASSSSWWMWPEEQTQQQQADQQQQHKLYMVRMLLGNELLADAIGSLAQQMNWDLLSVIYDDEPELVDLHDELIKQLFSRNIQLALDEQIPQAAADSYDRLLQMLAKKSAIGSRVVITLLGTGSARLLLDSLRHLRNSASSSVELVSQVNSLLWISVTDREPYYAFATDALGSVAISSSVSLIPEFRAYYDKLANEPHGATANKWWPEYMRAILLKHQRDIELVSNECARWQEPKVSPLNEKCRSLTLSSLVQFEKAANYTAGGKSRNVSATSTASDTQQQQAKLAKYLAGGWEHNGMDIINAVLAAANGLESLRQTMCPNQQAGLCDKMRELISPSSSGATSAASKLPLMSELIYNELLRSTFQLADGRMFNLDDFNSPVGQVEGKFKLYNLRYLQQNSIGFVKFGSFDQMDGLELNATKARHYPKANSYLDQEPIEAVKSTCEDENKCLMYGALSKQGSSPLSEEELAAGLNGLFKLDHPSMLTGLSTDASDAATGDQAQQQQQQQPGELLSAGQQAAHHQQVSSKHAGTGTDGRDVSGRQQQQQTIQADDSQVHTMRSAPAMSRFNWSSTQHSEASGGAGSAQHNAIVPATFNTIVLLPLHGGSASTGGGCSEQLDMEHSFQLLMALAYVQQSVNGAASTSLTHWPPPAPQSGTDAARVAAVEQHANSSSSSSNNDDDVQAGSKQPATQIELTTTVIDYCDQLEMAKTKLLTKLAESGTTSTNSSKHQQAGSRRREQQQQQQSLKTRATLPVAGKTVAVIDFDAQISENIDNIVEDRQLLHLTIGGGGSRMAAFNHQLNMDSHAHATIDSGAQQSESTPSAAVSDSNGRGTRRQQHNNNHLKISLMPSKSNEIQALVKLISSMPQWRLVHLIYTDHHRYRDEFVRRANEANICVSKLIWIPTILAGESGSGSNNNGRPNDDDDGAARDNANAAAEATGGLGGGRQMVQLEKTRALFARELHDYSTTATKGRTAASKQATTEPAADPSGAQGLNTTRVLVVLASSNDATNRMILEAASGSMLEDYVWVTSHEWLASVELPAAAASEITGYHKEAAATTRLPRLYLSTRLETYESHGFRRFISSLTPAIHSPLPSVWFDEFWQQHFRCRLPIPNRNSGGHAQQQSLPVCKQHQHLDLQRMVEDDRVHYVIEALESIQEALGVVAAAKAASSSNASFPSSSVTELSQEFRRSLERRRQLGADGAHLSRISHLPYGYHIVHRLLPPVPINTTTNGSLSGVSRRRANSRDLSAAESRAQGQLLRIGLWRDGQLILLNKKLLNNNNDTNNNNSSLPTDGSNLALLSHDHRWWLNSRASTGTDQDTASAISKSLARLGSVKSRCATGSQTCALCRQQVQQTMAIIRQEAALLGQSESVAEPNVISSFWSPPGGDHHHRQQEEVATFDDDEISAGSSGDNDADDDGLADGAATSAAGKSVPANELDSAGSQAADNIQAAASSLFDGATSKQVAERQRESADMRRLSSYAHMTKLQQARWGLDSHSQISLQLRHAPALSTAMISLIGVVVMVASMTYLYPNMLERAIKRTDNNGGQQQQQQRRQDLSLGSHTLGNINDYFLLTGLLMLYSINMAFLLPATMGVCWFRRIGLPTSYTVIFSSILVKVLHSCRQASRCLRSGQLAVDKQTQATQPIKQLHMDPLEDSVEVTFESLTQDHGTIRVEEDHANHVKQQQTNNCCSTITDPATSRPPSGYQTSDRTSDNNKALSTGADDAWEIRERWYSCRDPATLLTISICLILCQVVVSLVWFIQQPPEPTLYYACWRCASPIRSPILFLYEPLLSLLYPALILTLTWILAIIAYRLASQNEEQYRIATRRLLSTATSTASPFTSHNSNNNINDNQLKFQQRQMDYKLRDAKSLVMATTLIVTVWSILTLNMISSSHNKLMPTTLNAPAGHSSIYSSINPSDSSASDTKTVTDLSLVYANLISGAIIYSLLFIYRLHLFNCGTVAAATRLVGSLKGRNLSPLASSSNKRNNILKFNSDSRRPADGSQGLENKWLSSSDDMYPMPPADDPFFTGSQFSTASNGRHERLKLQQFNSSYGTYSMAGPTENYHTSTTINPLHTLASDGTRAGGNRPVAFGLYADGGAIDHRQGKGDSLKRRQKAISSSSFFGGGGRTSKNKKKQPPVPKVRTFTGGSGGPSSNGGSYEFKLQRRQSSGSVASSTAKLVGDNHSMDNDMFMDDTISCASSVASSSTSQLHGNDLYPIDCSIQLDSQLPNNNNNNSSGGPQIDGTSNGTTLNRSNSFSRRSSLRKSITQANKLSSVREEQVTIAGANNDKQQLSLDSGTATTVTDLSELAKTPDS